MTGPDDDTRFARSECDPQPDLQPPDAAMLTGEAKKRSFRVRIALAAGIPCVAWFVTTLPPALFIAGALDNVGALTLDAFASEYAVYLGMSLPACLGASVFVLPAMVGTVEERGGSAPVALGVLAFIVYGITNFIVFSFYALRIT